MHSINLAFNFFLNSKNGDISGDFAAVLQIAQTCGFFFFLVTSVAGGVQAREIYMQKNKSTVYATKFQAVVSVLSSSLLNL